LRARKSAISVCLGTVVPRRGSARFTYLLCFAPSSARTHPRRTSSHRFHLYLELLDDDLSLGKFRQIYRLSDHFDGINQIFAGLFQGLALCERARNIICPSYPTFSILHKTGLDLHKIVTLSGILRESGTRSQPTGWRLGTGGRPRTAPAMARAVPLTAMLPHRNFTKSFSDFFRRHFELSFYWRARAMRRSFP